jgi:hypothetical protein
VRRERRTSGARELPAETSQRQRGQEQAEIAESDVEVARDEKQVGYDEDEPTRDYIGKETRLKRDTDAGDDLNDAGTIIMSWWTPIGEIRATTEGTY